MSVSPLESFVAVCYAYADILELRTDTHEVMEMTWTSDWHLSSGVYCSVRVYDALEVLDGEVRFDLVAEDVCDCTTRNILTASDRFCTKCIDTEQSYDFDPKTCEYLRIVSDPNNW